MADMGYQDDDYNQSQTKRRTRKILINAGDSEKQENWKQEEDDTDQHHTDTATGQAANPVDKASSREPISVGIIKNVSVDLRRQSFFQKWFRALFQGIPYTMDNEITMFQVFPPEGVARTIIGNACDQVIVYGKMNKGAIITDNEVEIYGSRNADNLVIANMIRNKASGTILTPARCMSPITVWIITVAIVAVIIILVLG